MLLETHGSRARGRERAVLCCVLGTLAPALGPAKSTAHDDRPAGCRLPRLLSTTQRTEARLAQMRLLLSGVLGKLSEPAFSRNAYLRSCAACRRHTVEPRAPPASFGLARPCSAPMVLPGETAEEEVACEDNLAHASMVCAARAAAQGVARRALCAAIFHTPPSRTLSLLPHFRGVIFRNHVFHA